MSLLFLLLILAGLWINALGAGLLAWRVLKDYPVARAVGLLAPVLVGFFLEHLAGWGPRPPLLPFTTLASLVLIWRHRAVWREHWSEELVFAAGFFYCFAWRYRFPSIDLTGEKMSNLALITAYLRGETLPAPDLWLPPYRIDFYYSFQHYGAALFGRVFHLGAGFSYHLAYCTLAGLITLLAWAGFARWGGWKPGRWFGTATLLFGGSGAVVAAHVLLDRVGVLDSVRFLGGAIRNGELNDWGRRAAAAMASPGVEPRDLPMEPLSYIVSNGDYHPPLMGYVLLALAALLLATLVRGAAGRARDLAHGLLAATLPLTLIANAWVFPLQALLVLGWFAGRWAAGERNWLKPALAGLGVTLFLAYPFLLDFTQQAIGDNAAIGLTAPVDLTPALGWFLTFWPVAGILLLAAVNRERGPEGLRLALAGAGLLAFTEFCYNHDVYGGVWSRFNTTMKWWPWVYAAILLTAGAWNLGAKSRVTRYGTLLLLLPTWWFAGDLASAFRHAPRVAVGQLDGSGWIKSPVLHNLIHELRSRPDGVTLESGLVMANTEAPSISLFAGKACYLGWPWHETTWRGPLQEIPERMAEVERFYAGKLDDPLAWLLRNNIRYVLWLPRDNLADNSRFDPLDRSIRSRYLWRQVYSAPHLLIGYWERVDSPAVR